MATTKNIIFDLGGVLINLNFSKTTQAFRDLGFLHFEKMYSQSKVDQLFEKLETGAISEDDFYTVLLGAASLQIDAAQIRSAWNSLLLDYRKSSLAFLSSLKSSYKTYLLSNTNAIHFTAFNKILEFEVGLSTLDSYFTKTYYSHLLGLRKPNNDIFDFVVSDAGIKITETLFIDDTPENIDAARAMGFKTHLLLPGEMIELLDYDRF